MLRAWTIWGTYFRGRETTLPPNHFLKQRLAIRKDVLGERHPAYADTSLSNVAWLLNSQRDYAAAKLLFEQGW